MKAPLIFVDDDPDQLFLYRTVGCICRLEYPVETVSSYQELFTLLDSLSRPPVVIFLDVHMPGQDGFATLEALRRLPQYRHIPVIMLTASADSQTIERAYQAGANAYLVKPATGVEAMVAMVQQIRAYWLTYNVTVDPYDTSMYWSK